MNQDAGHLVTQNIFDEKLTRVVTVSGQLQKIAGRLRRLGSKAKRDGDTPQVWLAIGECVSDLELLARQVRGNDQ